MEGQLFSLFENSWQVGSGGAWLERCPREHFPEADIRPACSTADAAVGLHRDALEPPRGAWLGEWAVEVTRHTDEQGWRYGAAFAVFLAGSDGMGASTPSHNVFLERGIRRRRWVRRYGAPSAAGGGGGGAAAASPAQAAARGGLVSPAPAAPAAAAAAASAAAEAASPSAVSASAAAGAAAAGGGAASAAATAAAAAAKVALPLSPPAPAARRPADAGSPASAFLEALRVSLPIRTGAEAEQLTPAGVAADLEALNRLLQVLRRAVGVVQRAAAAATAAPQALTAASLTRGAQDMTQRLSALEGICKARSSSSAGGGAGGGSSSSSSWHRLAGQCASLQRQVGDEVARLERPLPARGGGAPAAAAASHAVTAAAAAAQLEAQQQLQAQAQLSEAEWALQDAEERERDILHIAREVSEVADMFRDLNVLVVAQGEAIEKIEERAGEAAEHAKKGVEEVREASRKQRHSQVCAVM